MDTDETAQRERVKEAVDLAQSGRVDEAIVLLKEIIRDIPSLPSGHHNLAVALASQGKREEAIASFSEALRLAPHYSVARLNHAKTLLDIGEREKAADEFRRVIREQPDNADALNALGLTLTQLKKPGEGKVFLKHAARLRPDFPEAHNNLGLALADLADFKNAEAAYDQALRLRPEYIEALTNLASAYAYQQRFAEALAQYELALCVDPNHVSAHWNRSLSLLQSGDFKQGWAEYEWRHRREKSPMRSYSQSMWDGNALNSKTILVWCEQGLGDTFQFCRYIRLLKQNGAGQVVFECPSPLLRVMRRFQGVDQLVPEGQPLPPFDVHVPLMSLPYLFETTIDTILADVPYIRAESDPFDRYRQNFDGFKGLKIGIAWQGNPNHQWDRYRSVPLKNFLPLARIEDARIFSLQRGPGTEQLSSWSERNAVVELLDPTLSDAEAWADIAAIMKNLDLVVTVDTATAHLAGALGVHTYIALAKICDWRWLTDREDSPWYPSVSLFRQDELGKWQRVFQRIASSIARLIPQQ